MAASFCLASGGATAAVGRVEVCPVSQYRLANGMRVALQPDRGTHMVAVNLGLRVGAADEEPHQSGYAHLIEHMWFQGSAHISKHETDVLVTRLGGVEDAITGFDWTYYYAVVPANQLERILWLRSDQLGFVADYVDAERLRNQVDVARNERRQRWENNPYQFMEFRLFELLFPAPHPYHGVIIGSHEDLQAATVESVRAFLRHHYGPANASLVISGDFDEAETRAWVERYFGSLTGAAPPPRPESAQAPPPAPLRAMLHNAELPPRLLVGWVTAPAFSDGDAEIELAALVLAEGRASLLYRELVHHQRVAQDVACELAPLALGSLLECRLTPARGVDLATLERALDRTLADFIARGPEADDLARSKMQWKARFWQKLEHLDDRAAVLNRFQTTAPELGRIAAGPARIDAVTASSLRRAAHRWLDLDHRAVVTLTAP